MRAGQNVGDGQAECGETVYSIPLKEKVEDFRIKGTETQKKCVSVMAVKFQQLSYPSSKCFFYSVDENRLLLLILRTRRSLHNKI